MLENIRLSIQGIWSHKMRSFLTMLGIIIGIASIISIVSTIQGTNEQIKKNLIGSGNNTVDIKLYQGDMEYYLDDYSGIPKGVPVVTEKVREEMEKVDGEPTFRSIPKEVMPTVFIIRIPVWMALMLWG